MKLKEFLEQSNISPTKFAANCGISVASISYYVTGKRRPRQKVAQRIERVSKGLVTVLDLRGEDARIK